MASKLGMLGSVDANTGSPDLGWDTDQFPTDVKNATFIMKVSYHAKKGRTGWLSLMCTMCVWIAIGCAGTRGADSRGAEF